ncbi:MAG: methyltransferase domain-containing protein [Acidobacteria bacterium]|nr:methyltransferase domain-containing protein [Acidobacteriota bacterium]NIM61993.1 methyltransferase domain-containing protein [Acidobacteriota bacterium]NIO58951.1 methyltransferase domain-containing protein [Acidobacteriota bacterium]NIQ29997.1 methyltransferase domain-containing protein [Acidobacteriota bacterium]NIQ84076.1 methyltransferase domain-containing protein [Acidobacteriota bacterium]
MKRFGLVVLGLVLVGVGAPPVGSQQGGGSKVSTSYDKPEGAELLAGPSRYEWQRPDRVIGLLAVREGEKIADIGAGMGYFTNSLSQLVGATGRIYAVETDARLVRYLERENEGHFFDNTVVVQATDGDLGLPTDGTLDLVLAVNTWHRFGKRGPALDSVRRALKPGGRFVIVDWHDGEIPIAPPVEERLSLSTLIAEMKGDGWTVTTNSRLLKYQYLVIFTPPAP